MDANARAKGKELEERLVREAEEKAERLKREANREASSCEKSKRKRLRRNAKKKGERMVREAKERAAIARDGARAFPVARLVIQDFITNLTNFVSGDIPRPGGD